MGRLFVLLMLVASVMSAPIAGAQGKAAPPHSNAFGRSLSEWMKLYFTRLIEGGEDADHVGRVQFLPLPEGIPSSGTGSFADPVVLEGHRDVTLSPGSPFVLPISVWVGETYDPALGVPDDVPLDPSIFTDSNVQVMLDGKPLIDSSVDDLSDYYVGPVDFDSPIVYGERGSNGAVAAIWVQGLGFVHHPLSVGTHTLTLHSEILIPEFDLGLVFNNEWTITVEPASRR